MCMRDCMQCCILTVQWGLSSTHQVQADTIYAALRELIVQSQFRPGQRLTEAELAARFGSSRTPVREALRKLERDGWIVLVPHRGCHVRQFTVRELDDTYEVRIALERLSVALAIRQGDAAILRRLAARWAAFADPPDEDSGLEMLAADEEFHETLARCSGNVQLIEHLKRINEQIRIVRRIDFTRAERRAQTISDHRTILSHVLDHDVMQAQAAVEDHVRVSKAAVKSLARIYLIDEPEFDVMQR